MAAWSRTRLRWTLLDPRVVGRGLCPQGARAKATIPAALQAQESTEGSGQDRPRLRSPAELPGTGTLHFLFQLFLQGYVLHLPDLQVTIGQRHRHLGLGTGTGVGGKKLAMGEKRGK